MKEKKPSFKAYQQHQMSMIPINLEELISPTHMVRVIDRAIEKMDMTPLMSQYEGGGAPAYHPVMMLKVIVYAYADKIYSSRRIAKATRENIHFMWLTGNTSLDFMTINRFRGERLKGIIEDIFTEVVKLLIDEEYVKFENYFLDGTKIEANASKYSWVWGKNTHRNMKNLREKVIEHLKEIDIIEDLENAEFADADLPETGNGKEINSEAIEEFAKKVDERLSENPDSKPLRKAKKAIEKDYLPRMEKYENQLEILEERKSYSKTDTDATFMRMKEDHMKNGQLKPGFNVQIGTEDQFITGYSIHQKPGDTTTMKGHIEKVKHQMDGKFPKNVITDAGYGSEQNYDDILSNRKREALITYNMYIKEQQKKYKQNEFNIANWDYDEENDRYTCPNQQQLEFKYRTTKTDKYDFTREFKVYECEDCSECPLRSLCTKAKEGNNRKLMVNEKWEQQKEYVRAKLSEEKTSTLYRQRKIDVEPVFGFLKANLRFTRFSVRGKSKVENEMGIALMAVNLRKFTAIS